MGGEGSMAGMIVSLKNNRLFLTRNKQRRREVYEKLKEPTKSFSKKLKFKQISEVELQKIRIKLKSERNKENKKTILILLTIIMMGVILIYLIFKYMGLLKGFL